MNRPIIEDPEYQTKTKLCLSSIVSKNSENTLKKNLESRVAN